MALFANVQFNKLLNYKRIDSLSRLYCCSSGMRGVILGVYSKSKKENSVILTSASEHYNNITEGKLLEAIELSGNSVKKGKSFLYWGLCSKYKSVAVVGLGDKCQGYNELEDLNEKKESIRIAINAGYKKLNEAGITEIDVDEMGDAEAAAEGITLSTWVFNSYKTKKKNESSSPKIELYSECEDTDGWQRGLIKAEAQNLARTWMETPSNKMTPTIFSNIAKELLEALGVTVTIRNKEWIEEKKMGGLLCVTKGSAEPPKFLEIIYCAEGQDGKKPVVLVGKGVTFDSGGISLKPSLNMDAMRADMGGAANVLATIYAAAKLQLPINLVGLIPLCENMPSGTATKPGDVITTMSGKTVCVDNTDAEGRLILADALYYSKDFNPKLVIDIATLTGAMSVALGDAASGIFTNSAAIWERFRVAGSVTGDRVWRFPLWKHYTRLVTDYTGYDINNIGKGKGGGSCSAAAFLREFVPENVNWVHLDIASVMGPNDNTKYLSPGMKGRPVRTLIQFIDTFSQ